VGGYDTLRLIESLDPETEYWRIHRLHALHEFPWDVTRALELGLYRTSADHHRSWTCSRIRSS
jgi:hypothetical protein